MWSQGKEALTQSLATALWPQPYLMFCRWDRERRSTHVEHTVTIMTVETL